MNTNIEDYVTVYDDFLEPDLCCKITGFLSGFNQWERHSYESGENKISYEDDLWVTKLNSSFTQDIMGRLWHAINDYVQYLNFSWFDGWHGYTDIRYNKYTPGTNMKIHCDFIHSIFDGKIKGIPKLTLLGSLNNDYEGGEFYLCDKLFPLKAGSLLIFPSTFLYPHEVKTVTTGTRYSFVSWVY